MPLCTHRLDLNTLNLWYSCIGSTAKSAKKWLFSLCSVKTLPHTRCLMKYVLVPSDFCFCMIMRTCRVSIFDNFTEDFVR